MPRRAVSRLHTLFAVIRHLLPAWLCFALAGAIDHPLSLVPLLVANALAMSGICHAVGFGAETSFARSVARRGLTYFVLLTTYAALVAAVLAAPAWWLSRDGTLPAALTLSAALVLTLFVLWRVWPVFALPFVWDDAYPRDDERGSWLLTALRRSLAFALHLTREHDLFFGYGLPAGIALLLLAVGALALAGLGGFLSGDTRIAVLALYALIIAPLAHIGMTNRCVGALLADARHRHRRQTTPCAGTGQAAADGAPALPPDISRAELDATLLCATHSAQINLALAALERGADPNALPGPDQRDQRSALMIAVTLPDLRLLRALIAKGADINKAHGGITPLIAATRDSYEGRPEAVTMLLSNGADARIADAVGNTPLHHAARCAEPIVAALLLDAAVDVNAINAEGMTALGIACNNANWNVAAFLLERGAKPDIAQAQPALVFAASVADDDPVGVKLLLKQRAIVDARAAFERTPLMAAALAGHPRIVETLLTAGADADLIDHRGTTALMEAARSGTVAAIHALGKRKANPDCVDAGDRSALIIACQSRHASEETVRALLSLGADRARVGADGKRALDHAAAAGRWHVVALLDPAYPLPSNLAGGMPPAQVANADHLLDALRFGHWNVAAEFAGALREWPPATLADLYLDLRAPEQGDARNWLLNHGLDRDVCTNDGRHLVDALVADLPASCNALRELFECGATPGGAGLIARVLASAPHGAEGHTARALARTLVERGADWCGTDAGQRSALHLAVDAGDAVLAARLLDLGADPNARDALGRTPLHLALKADVDRAVPLLRSLVHAGANPEIATATGETPLGLALARGEPAFAHWLGWTRWRLPLRRLRAADLPAAAADGDLDAVDRLIALGLPIDGVDAQGATALIRAAGSGHAALVVRLLEAGADTTHAAHSGIHCLGAAVGAKREAVVRTLLSHGIAPDTRMAGGGTALTIAAARGQLRIAEALLEAGADPNATDEHGTVPLHAVAQYAFDSGETAGARDLFELLLRAGARLDARDQTGQDTLLVLLGARAQPGTRCDAEHLLRLAQLLLERGARIDTQDQRGVGVLHACALHGLFGCARLLKAHGAPLDLLDGFERTAADVAGLLGYVDVAAELGSHAPMPGVRQTLRRPARAPD
ncbi:ankyrin repeat domain-containing protein [Dokdonella soli]|uniref:Ankyrin repeat domain-containing protein n=1 Tax=Dokdonella soli TaxID=529810 RepID=A0ABP3TL43_9GAMM